MCARRPERASKSAEKLFQQVEDTIRQVVPRDEIGTIIDNIGLPASNYNFAFGNGTFVAYNDGQILVTLAPRSWLDLRVIKSGCVRCCISVFRTRSSISRPPT